MKRAYFLSGLLISSAILSSSLAQAAPFKDAMGKIYIQDSGIVAGQKIAIGGSVPITKSGVFNQCGLTTVSAPSSTVPMPASVTVNGSSISVASLPVAVMPKCTLTGTSYAFSIPTTANFRTADGKLGILGTANTAASISYDGVFKISNKTADKCGMVSMPATATDFNYGGVAYSKASLPTKVPDRCIGGTRYTPVGGSSAGGSGGS